MKFRLNNALRGALKRNDFLGFDNSLLAAEAILLHEDWAERWEIEDTEDRTVVEQWRQATILENVPEGWKTMDTATD